MKRLIAFGWCVLALQGQTSIDLRTQSKDVDFSAAAATKPSKTGTTIPATCSIGETFFKLDAFPGSNLYLCTTANGWTVVEGTGGSGSNPFSTSASSSSVSVTNAQDAAFGCNGVNVLVPAGAASITRVGGNASETLKVGISCSDSRLKLIAPTNTFSCSAGGFSGCDNIAGSAFTDGVIPIASVAMTQSGASFTFGAVSDLRAVIQDDPPAAGTGISYTKSGSTRSISVDTSVVPILASSSDFTEIAPPGPPAAGKERVYAKAGSGLCAQNSAGAELCTGTPGVMGTAGQGSFVPFSLSGISGSSTGVTNPTAMRCHEFWQKVPYTLNLTKVIAQSATADSTNYLGFAIYSSTGTRVTAATSTGVHIPSGAFFSATLSGSPSLTATGDYILCWTNNGAGTVLTVNNTDYAAYLNSDSAPRTFDAGNAVIFTGSTITWPATIGSRTAQTTAPFAVGMVP